MFPPSHVSPRVLTLLQYCVLWVLVLELWPGWQGNEETVTLRKIRQTHGQEKLGQVSCMLPGVTPTAIAWNLSTGWGNSGGSLQEKAAVARFRTQWSFFLHLDPEGKFCHQVEPGPYRNQLCQIHRGPKALIFIYHGNVGVNNTHSFRPSSAPYMLACYGCHYKSYSAHHQFVVC